MTQISQSPYVVETSSERFVDDVIERSLSVPIVVDFWATWCQPCRILGPILEKLAREADGKFVLVKADTELVPNIAAGFGVRSIPAVFGIKDGRVVDSFLGALPESAIRAWLERLMPPPAEQKVADARRPSGTHPDVAESLYREALELAPNDPSARVGLAQVMLARGSIDEGLAQI